MTRVARAPLSCANCAGHINPGDRYRLVGGGNYHPGHAPDVAITGPFIQRATVADIVASAPVWGGDAA